MKNNTIFRVTLNQFDLYDLTELSLEEDVQIVSSESTENKGLVYTIEPKSKKAEDLFKKIFNDYTTKNR